MDGITRSPWRAQTPYQSLCVGQLPAQPQYRAGLGPAVAAGGIGLGAQGQALVASLLSVGSLGQMALTESTLSQHPFGGIGPWERPDVSGACPLAPELGQAQPSALQRFRLTQQGGLRLSQGHWQVASAATPGVQIGVMPHRASIQEVELPDATAQRLAQLRTKTWWWVGRWLGLGWQVGPWALPVPPLCLREPLEHTSPGDHITLTRDTSLSIFPGTLLGEAWGLGLAAGLHAGSQLASYLGWGTALMRAGINVQSALPTWLVGEANVFSLTRPTRSEELFIAEPMHDEAHLLLEPDRDAPRCEESFGAATGQTSPTSFVVVETGFGMATPWWAPSFDIPFVLAAHLGSGRRNGSRRRYVLNLKTAEGRLSYRLLQDALLKGDLAGNHSPLPKPVYSETSSETSHSAGAGVALPGVVLLGHTANVSSFSDLRTVTHMGGPPGAQQLTYGFGRIRERMRWHTGHTGWQVFGWTQPQPFEEGERERLTGLDAQEVGRQKAMFAEVLAHFAAVDGATVLGIASTLAARPWTSLRHVWTGERKGLVMAVRWPVVTHEASHPHPTLNDVVESFGFGAFESIGQQLKAQPHATEVRFEVSYQQTRDLLSEARWFVARVGQGPLSIEDRRVGRRLAVGLEQEAEALLCCPLLQLFNPRRQQADMTALSVLQDLILTRCEHGSSLP